MVHHVLNDPLLRQPTVAIVSLADHQVSDVSHQFVQLRFVVLENVDILP